jgi:hypothetical protein
MFGAVWKDLCFLVLSRVRSGGLKLNFGCLRALSDPSEV